MQPLQDQLWNLETFNKQVRGVVTLQNNYRTLWTEGMLLGPQHFQQHDRFLLESMSLLAKSHGNHGYGVISLEIDENALNEGTLALSEATGVFPDGTPFSLPAEANLPAPLAIDSDIRDQIIYLSVPRSNQSDKDVAEQQSRASFERYLLHDQEIEDRQTPDSDTAEVVFTGSLLTRLLPESADQAAFHTIPLARVLEIRSDNRVQLDSDFYPCAMSLSASQALSNLCRELRGLVTQRATELAGRLGKPNTSDTSQLTQFLLLQTLNRAGPLLDHLSDYTSIQPIELYKELAQLAGELATITHSSRLPPELAAYTHRDQYSSFNPIILNLRESLNWIPDSTTNSIPVEHIRAGIYKSTVKDLQLFNSSTFILAVKARVTPDELSRLLPKQTTIASKTKLRDLVEAQSHGVELKPMITVPNSIPMYDSYVYFEVQKNHPQWQEIALSGDIAMHIAGNFQDLQMQFWTIRS